MTFSLYRHDLVLVLTVSLFASGGLAQERTPSPPVVDLHVDLAYQLHVKGKHISDPSSETSFERMRRGNVGTLVLPLFVPHAHRLPAEQVRAEYDATYETLERALNTPAAQLRLTLPGRPAASGRIATVLAFEGADGFVGDPIQIVPWIERGACFVGLVHFVTNELAGSSTDPKSERRQVGLTDSGKLLARVVYSHGGLVDVSHASDAAIADVVEIAKDFGAPVVSTHSGVRALKPTDRNVSDDALRAVAASGGVVGIDLHSGHIGSRRGSSATLDDVVAHIEHAVRVAGIDHVAIGSDLNGGIDPPRDGDGAATWPLLARKLEAKGWRFQDIEALFGGNAARVLGWATTRGCGSATR